MSVLFKLPTEGILQILSHLPIPDILAFEAVCRGSKLLVRDNEGSVYRSAAISHGYVSHPLPRTIEEAVEQHRAWPDFVAKGWKQLCKYRRDQRSNVATDLTVGYTTRQVK